nr:RHS repeat-associated core domain-containing protein [Chryseobacterium sp.]
MKHEGYNILPSNPNYNYKYNGKELQETGMYDYGARFYMPDLGRWGVVDPQNGHLILMHLTIQFEIPIQLEWNRKM